MQKSIRIFDHNEDANLFELLRKKRWEIAQKQKVPAFMIFSDRSLHDMAKIKPQNKTEADQNKTDDTKVQDGADKNSDTKNSTKKNNTVQKSNETGSTTKDKKNN